MQSYKYKYIKYDVLKEKWDGIQLTAQTCDANFIKGNQRWIGVVPHTLGGGVLTLFDRNKSGKLNPQVTNLQCHDRTVQDFEFMPYTSDYLATCSADACIKLWKLPEQDSTLKVSELQPIAQLTDRIDKTNLITFNPVAQGILASSSSGEKAIRVHDVHTQKLVNDIELNSKDYAVSLDWNHDGTLLGTAAKDKYLRIIDPRKQAVVAQTQGHEGTTKLKFSWLGDQPYGFSCGFNKQNKREFKLWDIRNFGTVLQQEDVDQQSGTLYPFYDSDLGIMYLAGKGEGLLRYLEFQNGNLFHHKNPYQSPKPGRSYGMIPKYGLDTLKCEIGRFLKAGNDNTIEQISISYPKRVEKFSEDIFPPSAQAYALKGKQWAQGENSLPAKGTLNPELCRKNWDLDAEITLNQSPTKPNSSNLGQNIQPQQPVQQKQEPNKDFWTQAKKSVDLTKGQVQQVEQKIQVQEVEQKDVEQVIEKVQVVVEQPIKKKSIEINNEKEKALEQQIEKLRTEQQKRVEDLEGEIANLKGEINQKLIQINEIQQRSQKQEQELEKLSKLETQQSALIQELQTKIETDSVNNEKIKQLEKQIAELKELNQKLENEIVQITTSSLGFANKIETLSTEVASKNQQILDFQNQLANSIEANKAISNEMQELETKLLNSEDEKNQIQENLASVQQQVSDLINNQKVEQVYEEEDLGDFQTGNNALIVFAHPNNTNSFTSAMKQAIVEGLQNQGFQTIVSDLYQDDFDPRIREKDFTDRFNLDYFNVQDEQKHSFEQRNVPDILKREIKRVVWADYLIFVTPFWWGSVSAICKGWFDRVLLYGWAYDIQGQIYGRAGLKGKKAWLVTCSGGPENIYSPTAIQGMKLNDLLHHVNWNTFHFCGMDVVEPYNCYLTHKKSQEEREQSLEELRNKAANIKAQPLLYQIGDLNVNLGVQLPQPEIVQEIKGLSLEQQQQIREEVLKLREVAQQITGQQN